MIPRLAAPERRGALAGLLALGLLEALALAATAKAAEFALQPGSKPDGSGLALLAGAGAVAAGVFWARQTAAEDFGMRYANAVRGDLAERTVKAAGAGRPRRLGAVAVRLSSDLNALREWAAVGLSDLVAAAAAAAAGLAILADAAGLTGLAAGGAVLVTGLGLAAALWRPLARAHETLRQARGRVSGAAGDIALGAATLARFDAGHRETGRLARRGERLRLAAVRRRTLAALLAVPAPAGLSLGLLTFGLAAPPPAAGWAGVLLGLGFTAAATGSAARALDALIAFQVARRRLGAVDEAHEASAEHPAPADPPAGRPQFVLAADPAEACRLVEAMAAVARKGERPRERARRRPLASPAMPLIRGSVRRNLALRRTSATDAEIARALALAGLDPAAWPPERRIDPALDDPDGFVQGRLRLARAIVHRPRTIFVAEPTLLLDPDYKGLLERAAAATGASLVAAAR